MTGYAIRARGLSKTFVRGRGLPPLQALGPLDLDIDAGEFQCFVGPSGCGKTTLLEILAGLTGQYDGELHFDGAPVVGVPADTAVVFQQDASFHWLNVGRNIAFPLEGRGLTSDEIRARVDNAIRMVGLTEFRDAFPNQLSGGMRQRVCLARALVTRPRLLLLDEPFAALDAQTRLLMGDELLDLWRASGATIVLITHAIDEAVMLADRISIIGARPGRIIQTLRTGWPRTRDSRVAADAHFGVLSTTIWASLREQSMRAMGR